jgi:hypothetical protein
MSTNLEGTPNTKLTTSAQDRSDTITADYLNSAEILLDKTFDDMGSTGKFVGINRGPIGVLDVLGLPSERCIIVHTP